MDDRQRRALKRAHSALVKDLRVDAVRDHLISKHILDEDQLEAIAAKPTRRDRVSALLQLLPTRGPDAFPALVEALKPNHRWLADELEANLNSLNDSGSATAAEELDATLRAGAVPSLPTFHISRKQCVGEIRASLRELKEGHYLGVHGMPGIGKSVCMNEALRDPALLLGRFPGGVFWVSVGNVDQEALLNKLQALCERLSDDGAAASATPPNVEVARERLRKLLNRRPRPSLLVLDDVWHAWVLAWFELDACVAVTTRDARVLDRVDGRSVTVPLRDGFSKFESFELFSKRLDIPPDNLPPEAQDIHCRCQGSPIMIALLSGFLSEKKKSRIRESRNRWHKCLDILKEAKHEKLSGSYNIMDAIELTVKTLDDEHLTYFHSMAVFAADVGIPCEVLSVYWGLSKEDVEDTVMDDLLKMSLVQELVDAKTDTTLYSMHDLIFDYLGKIFTDEQKAEMHADLVTKYLDKYGTDLSRLPDDDYVLWYIGQHVHKSGQYDLFPRLYFDLGFVGAKLRVTGPSDLLSDYSKYREFLDKDSNDNVNHRRDFENFVRTAGHRAAALSEAHDPAAAVVQLALCQPDNSEVYRAAERTAAAATGRLFFRWRNKEAMRWSNVLLTKLFSGHVWDVVFTHEPNLVLAAYGDGHIKLWNMLTGDEHRSFHGHQERVSQLTVNPADGGRFVSASEDGSLKIWDLQTAIEEALGTGEMHAHRALHDESSGQRTPSPRIRHSSSSAFFPDSRRPSGPARPDNSENTLKGHGTSVLCVDWSPDGQYILSGADDGSVKVWDFFGEPMHDLPSAHEKNVTCCSFSPDSKYFATGSADGRVRLWATESGQELYTFKEHNLRVTSLCLSNDNDTILSVAEKEIFVWVWNRERRPSRDYTRLQMRGRSPLDHDMYLCSRLSRDQRQLVVGTSSNMYETWDLHERRVIATQRGFAGSVTSLVFSHDGEHLLAGADNTVTTCSLTATPKVEESLQPLFSARFLSPDPGSLLVAAITSNNGVQVLKGLEGKVALTTTPVGEKIIITKINKAGTMVAFGCEDGSVGVYKLPAPGDRLSSEPNILGKHGERVISLKFGPKDTVVSGSEDKTMKVWWPDKTSVSCGGNDGAVTQVGLYEASDQGLIAVSCSRDGTLKGWRAPPEVRLPRSASITPAKASEEERVVARVYRADSGKLVTRFLAHSGATVTCYRIVRAAIPTENGAGGDRTARDRSPCPPDLVVVTAAVDGTVKMSRLCTGELLKTFSLEAPVRTFRLSADAHLLVTGHDDGSVMVTRTDHMCKPLKLKFHETMVNDLAVHPEGRDIISLGDSLAWWRLSHEESVTSPRGRAPASPASPRLEPPARRHFNYNRRQSLAPELRASLRQVMTFRGTLAKRLVVSEDWTTLVTIDDAGVLYVLQVM